MTHLLQVQQAIAAIESQRAALGETTAAAVLAALHEKLRDLRGAAPAQAAQRKQVTVLFASVKGFTSLMQALPQSNVMALINMLWQRLDEAIIDHGGRVDKHVGDAVMGVFGAPLTQEDDAAQAVRAGLTMRTALRDFVHEMTAQLRLEAAVAGGAPVDPQRFHNLQIQIGVNTGLVLLGEIGSDGEYTVMGDAVNVASRLRQAAPPGGILIARQTQQLVEETFELQPVDPLTVKGKAEPLEGYLVAGQRPARTTSLLPSVQGVTTRLIGREAELQRLDANWREVVATRTCRMVMVVGEVGIGKSRLVQEWVEGLQAEYTNAQVLHGRAEQRLRQLPYTLIRDLLTTTFGIHESDRTAVAREKLRRGVARLLHADETTTASYARTLGQLIGLSAEAEEPLTAGARERAYDAVAGFVRELAQRSVATLLWLEDLHWADEGSLLLLPYLWRQVSDAPLLIVCQTRPLLFRQYPAWAETAATCEQITLAPLSTSDSCRLVRDILRKLPQVPAELCDLIVQTADGNPFYVEELVKVLIEDGVIVPGPATWTLATTQLTRVRVPATLTGVIQARLDRLPALERAVLQRAAVVGRVFWYSSLLALNEATPQPFAAEQIQAALHALEQREMIFRRPTSIFSGQRAYVFKHALLREVAYESVLLRERPLFHRQTAEWLVAQSGERVAEHAALIAGHYELAGEWTNAARLFEQAAGRAAERYEPAQAIHYYRRVLQLLDQPHHIARHLRIQEKLSRLYFVQARLADARETAETLRRTAERDGDLVRQAVAWNWQARLHLEAGQWALAVEDTERAMQVAWLIDAELEQMRALLLRTEAYWRQAAWQAARAVGLEALILSQRLAAATETVDGLYLLACLCHESGELEEAERYRDLLAAQAVVADREAAAYAHGRLGRLHAQFDGIETAESHLRTALQLYEQLGERPAVARAQAALGAFLLERGQADEAVDLLQTAVETAEAAGHCYDALFYRLRLVRAWSHLGETAAAAAALQPVIAWREREGEQLEAWRGLPALEQAVKTLAAARAAAK